MRVGFGYDVHRLVVDRPLILGGVEIPFEKGLAGHSDADVLTHSIIDAILGAAALGDIGTVFPDSDASNKDAYSIDFLRKVCTLLKQNGYTISNIDSTVVAQRPKLLPYVAEIRACIANAAEICIAQISVKATTEEMLGFTGAGDGISAYAVALIY